VLVQGGHEDRACWIDRGKIDVGPDDPLGDRVSAIFSPGPNSSAPCNRFRSAQLSVSLIAEFFGGNRPEARRFEGEAALLGPSGSVAFPQEASRRAEIRADARFTEISHQFEPGYAAQGALGSSGPSPPCKNSPSNTGSGSVPPEPFESSIPHCSSEFPLKLVNRRPECRAPSWP